MSKDQTQEKTRTLFSLKKDLHFPRVSTIAQNSQKKEAIYKPIRVQHVNRPFLGGRW